MDALGMGDHRADGFKLRVVLVLGAALGALASVPAPKHQISDCFGDYSACIEYAWVDGQSIQT